MISIRCTQLEQARKNPLAYAQLIVGEKKGPAGTYGMFSCVQDAARAVHLKEKTVAEAIANTQKKFLRYVENEQNITKQQNLIDWFIEYCNSYEAKQFKLVDLKHQMNWSLVADVKLTGLTPWVVKNEEGLHAYFLVEKSFDWVSELRFPLYQHYIANNTINCKLNDLKVGIYCLEKGEYDFHCFTQKQIMQNIDETKNVLSIVNDEYQKIKK